MQHSQVGYETKTFDTRVRPTITPGIIQTEATNREAHMGGLSPYKLHDHVQRPLDGIEIGDVLVVEDDQQPRG
ncbi:hypothetical protein VSS92_30265, partial [Pseudomonas syringae pv. tagetis]